MNKNLDFVLTKIKITFKENKEYKFNLWSGIFTNIFIVLVLVLFWSVFSNLTSEIIKWDFNNFILYSVLTLAGTKSYFLFCIRRLNMFLISGELNLVLSNPINNILYLFFQKLTAQELVIFPILITVSGILVLNGVYTNYLFAIFVFIFGMFFHSLVISTIECLAFFMKNNLFLYEFYSDLKYSLRHFTPKMYENLSFAFYYFPTSFSGYFVIEILKGRTDLILSMSFNLFIISFIFILILIYLFKFGLKRYEAFG